MPHLTLQHLDQAVRARIQDHAPYVSPQDVRSFIEEAIRVFNHDKPRTIKHDIPGNGTQDYALPTSFLKGFSDIEEVEIPTGEVPRTLRRRKDDWSIYEDPSLASGQQLRLTFRRTTPASGETIRITLTTPHDVRINSSTLNFSEFQAIVHRAVALGFEALASRFVQAQDQNTPPDTITGTNQVANYRALARDNMAEYKRLVGLTRDVKPAQAMGEIDITFLHGEDLIFHPASQR